MCVFVARIILFLFYIKYVILNLQIREFYHELTFCRQIIVLQLHSTKWFRDFSHARNYNRKQYRGIWMPVKCATRVFITLLFIIFSLMEFYHCVVHEINVTVCYFCHYLCITASTSAQIIYSLWSIYKANGWYTCWWWQNAFVCRWWNKGWHSSKN